MGVLDNLLGNTQHQQDYQNFVQRYQQGAPHEGYTDQEVLQRYQQVAPQLAAQDYQQAAQQAFDHLSPQERVQFGQYVQQQAQAQGTPIAGFGQGVAQEAYRDPGYLAQQTAQLHQQQPGLLPRLLGGSATNGAGLLGGPVARAALAGIAAMAVSKALGNGMAANGMGGPLGGQPQGGSVI